MELKNKVKQIILAIICGVFLITALFFGAVAAFYSISGGAPNIFGKYLYLVKTDAFDLLENGTALIAEEVDAYEIQPWNIVIFTLENDAPALAEIRSSELADGVYSFKAVTENGAEITLSQSQVVAKGMTYSNFWGAVISFATSPIGVMLIAVVPCFVIIAVEITKFIRKTLPQPEIETVKKQQETPTYTPDSTGRAGVMSAYKAGSLDDSIGIYDGQGRHTIDRTDVLEISSQPETPLFLRQSKPAPKPQQKRSNETMPLSQKKLNAAIAAAKAEREMQAERERTAKETPKPRIPEPSNEKEHEEFFKNVSSAVLDKGKAKAASDAAVKNMMNKADEADDMPAQRSVQRPTPRRERADFKPEFTPSQPAARTPQPRPQTGRRNSDDDEKVKQYTPRKLTTPSSNHVTTSIPRLDALLNEDVDGDYNIDEILASLDRRG